MFGRTMLPNNLQDYNAILAAIVDSSYDAIISKDLKGFIVSWNKAAEQIFGYSQEEVIGRHITLLIPLDRRQEEDEIIKNIQEGNKVEHFETIRLHKDGRELNISLTISPIRNREGVIVGASKIARDITLQKQVESERAEKAAQLNLVNAVGKSILSELDLEAIIQKVTDATTKISGAAFGAFFYNRYDDQGESYSLYAIAGVSKKAFENFPMPRNTAIFSKTFSGQGTVRSDDIRNEPGYGRNSPHAGIPAGHLPVLSYLAVPVISQSGQVIGGLFFGHPKPGQFKEEHEKWVEAIATQAAIAIDNAQLYAEIKTLNSHKDEFIGFASHELNTPLTTLKGYIQLANMNPEITASLLPRMEKQTVRLSAIIADLLDVSKIQNGKLSLNFSKTQLADIVNDSIESVTQNAATIHNHFFVEDMEVYADAQKIGQVLINLLNNAIKYSPENPVITVTTTRLGNQVQISVADNGSGIAPEDVKKIFNLFYRVGKSREYTEGLGVGLYLSQQIMEGHRGKIWVESKPGEGSTFFISFPVETPQLFR